MSEEEGYSVVTIVTRFPTITKDQERHDTTPRRVNPRTVPRSEMRRFIDETLEDMERAQCEFQFCPGPDKPTAHMQTCFVCYRVKRLRVMRGWLSDPETR